MSLLSHLSGRRVFAVFQHVTFSRTSQCYTLVPGNCHGWICCTSFCCLPGGSWRKDFEHLLVNPDDRSFVFWLSHSLFSVFWFCLVVFHLLCLCLSLIFCISWVSLMTWAFIVLSGLLLTSLFFLSLALHIQAVAKSSEFFHFRKVSWASPSCQAHRRWSRWMESFCMWHFQSISLASHLSHLPSLMPWSQFRLIFTPTCAIVASSPVCLPHSAHDWWITLK